MKKSLLIASLLAIGLAACGENEEAAPAVEEPVVEAPAAEAPVVEAPVVEAPATEAAVVEAPAVVVPEEQPAAPATQPQ